MSAYRSRVREHLGEDLDGRVRLRFVNHAVHADDESPDRATHTVSYLGVLFHALRDLGARVERGVEPAPSTAYRVVDGQVLVPSSAPERRGIQPVVSLLADGVQRADVPVGDEVAVRLVAEVPPGAALPTTVEWDLEDSGTYALVDRVEPAARVTLERPFRVDRDGTHFVTVRVTSQRDGNPADIHTRVRVVAH